MEGQQETCKSNIISFLMSKVTYLLVDNMLNSSYHPLTFPKLWAPKEEKNYKTAP